MIRKSGWHSTHSGFIHCDSGSPWLEQMVLDANVPKLGSFPCLLSPTFWESNKEQTSSLFLKAGSWHLCPHALCRPPFLPYAGLGHQPGRWHARSDLFPIVTPQLVLTQLITESNSPWAGFHIQPHFDFLENKDYTSTWKLLMHNSVDHGTKARKAPC